MTTDAPSAAVTPTARRRQRALAAALLLLAGLGCGTATFVGDLAPLDGPVYWVAVTETPRPTVTVWLGTTTPVYAPTAVPPLLTTTPFWTTVTATPLVAPATATATPTPWGFTATPVWVTTTPVWITATPQPPVTTTPGLPRIGYTTPEPLPTPVTRTGTFYLGNGVRIGRPPGGLVVRVLTHTQQPSPRQSGATFHYLTVQLHNRGGAALRAPAAELFFVRRVQQGETTRLGRWTAAREPLTAQGLPDYAVQDGTPLAPGELRTVTLGFVLPQGDVSEVGLLTDWQRPSEGGLPVWFLLQPDPLGLVEAPDAPPPTPRLPDDGWPGATPSSATPPPGGATPGASVGEGGWPTTGTVTRGFGCHAFYTGIDGAGYGCPEEQPWFHNGVDIANSAGTAVWTPVDGTVAYAGAHTSGPDCSHLSGSEPPHQGLGNYQKVRGAETLHYFGHLSGFVVTEGAVTAGQTTAAMGSTGCSTGSHLHWTLYRNGVLVDPAAWAGAGP